MIQKRTPPVFNNDNTALDRDGAQFEALVAGSIQGILMVRDNRIALANPAVAGMFGYPDGESMIGLGVDALFPGAELQRIIKAAPSGKNTRSLPEHLELQGMRNDGGLIDLEALAMPVTWENAPAIQITLADLTVRHQSEERFRNLVEASLQGIYVHHNFKPLFVNQAFAHMLGFDSAEDAMAVPCALEYYVPTEHDRLRGYHEARISGKEAPSHYEVQGVRKDGSVVWLENIARVVNWGGQRAVQATLLDITERKQAEHQLRTHQRLLHTVMDTIPHAINVKDLEGHYLLVNRAMADNQGSTPERLIGASAQDLPGSSEAEKQALMDFDRRVMETGEPVDVEGFHMTSAAGKDTIRHIVKLPLRDEAGEITGILTIAENITQRMRSEQALRESEERFRDLVESSVQGISIHRNNALLFANQASVDIFGYDGVEELLALEKLDTLCVPEDLEGLRDYLDTCISGDKSRKHYAFRGIRKDGTVVWLESMVRPVVWNGLRALQTTLIDITERKHAEEELQASRRLLQTVFDTLPIHLFVKDVQGRYLMANRALVRFFDGRTEDFIGRTSEQLSFVAPEIRQLIQQTDDYILHTGETLDDPRVLVRNHRGADWYLHLIKRPLWDEQDRVIGLIGMWEDITGRVLAEERLRESQHLMRTVIDTIPHPIYVKGVDGRYLMVNQAFARYGNLPLEHYVGKRLDDLELVPAVMRETLSVADGQVFSEGEPQEIPEMEMPQPDGEVSYLHLIKFPLRDPTGKVIGLVGLDEDITSRVLAERQLRASRRLLQLVVDTVPHAINLKSVDGRFLMVNNAYAGLYGLTPQQVIGRHIADLPGATDELVQGLTELDRRVVETHAPAEIPEIHFRKPDGTVALRYIIKLPVNDDQGQVNGIVGISEDITERKRAEEALRGSQRLLTTVFESLPQSINVKDLQRRFLMVNTAMAIKYGLQPADFIGHTLEEMGIYSEDQQRITNEKDEEIFQRGRVIKWPRIKTVNLSGEQVFIHLIKAPLKDDQNNTVGVVTLSENVSDIVRAEEELQSQRALLQTVFDVLPFPVFVKDREDRFVMINYKMAEEKNQQPGKVEGTPVFLSPYLSEEQKAFLSQLNEGVMASGQAADVAECPLNVKDETRLYHLVRVPLRDSAGNIVGLVGLNEDITERKRTEQALRQTQKLESLGVLTGGIAHDFNNLLVPILGNASMALNQLPAGSTVTPVLKHIEQAGQRAAELCRQMLAYSGKGSFEVCPVDLNRLIEEMTQLLRVSISKNITLEFQFDSLLPSVSVDSTQIRQVLMNLVINASEAIGDAPGLITLTTRIVQADMAYLEAWLKEPDLPEGTYVCLDVSDNGCGMDEETVARIFDPFFTTKFTGRGLGLAAVVGIARSHKGALKVESTLGQETTFRFLLPIAESAEPAAVEPSVRDEWSGSGTVLVVDDELPIRQLAGDMLENLGFTVLMASDGEEAVHLFQEHADDIRLVLLDMTMPRMNGEETMRRIHAIRPQVLVILMSGYSVTEVQARFQGEAFWGFLQKPFRYQTLKDKLREMLG